MPFELFGATTGPVVCRANPGHYEGILKVAAAIGWPPASIDKLRRFDRCPGNRVHVVVGVPGRVVGYVLSVMLDRRQFYVAAVAVAAPLRRTGIGRALLDRLATEADWGGRTVLVATINECDDDARRFLAACGFTAARLDRGAFGDRDGYRMTRQLAPVGAFWGKDRACEGR